MLLVRNRVKFSAKLSKQFHIITLFTHLCYCFHTPFGAQTICSNSIRRMLPSLNYLCPQSPEAVPRKRRYNLKCGEVSGEMEQSRLVSSLLFSRKTRFSGSVS
ncbi:hypothetical protein CDAR_503411 [Caerostris darwini]|uniref:Secreted protein n=1 Tax=Caerostris darwini TaxID=1538125 RepID=A0AAV4NX28_9ARAC|nr:hypothetical protein CDAR_503341 [Caerostris darwini]GIX89305.1 hypothetical protein CDAR_503411 [Caerostris darwini]